MYDINHREAFIQSRAATVFETYPDFAQDIAMLKTELGYLATYDQHPDFLGNGSNAVGILLHRPDGQYVARLGLGDQLSEQEVDNYVDGLVVGGGIERLEQLRAASYEDATTISERLSGETVSALGFAGLSDVTDVQINTFVDLIGEANDMSINLDVAEGNILYDAFDGFGLIDYKKDPLVRTDRFHEFVCFAGHSLISSDGLTRHSTPEAYEQARAMTASRIQFLRRYEELSRQRMPALDADRLSFAGMYTVLERQYDDYGNTGWVNRYIGRQKASRIG